MPSESRISIRVSPEDKARWEIAAKEQDRSFTQFVREGMMLRAGFDPIFWDEVQELARTFRVDSGLVLQNVTIGWMAARSAHREVWGQKVRVLDEFRFAEDGPITGEKLFKRQKSKFVHEFTRQKADISRREDTVSR